MELTIQGAETVSKKKRFHSFIFILAYISSLIIKFQVIKKKSKPGKGIESYWG